MIHEDELVEQEETEETIDNDEEQQEQEEEVAPEQPIPTEQPSAATVLKPPQFVTKKDLEGLTVEKFNDILGKVYAAAVNDTRAMMLRELPQFVTGYSQKVATAQQKAQQFFDEHPELQRHESFVAYVARTVMAQHPDWDYNKILSETAKLAKKELGYGNEPGNRRVSRPTTNSRLPARGMPSQSEIDLADILGE